MHATPNTQVWATTILDKCRELVQSHLRPHLQKMFENSDLAFLEFAEKAQSSGSQMQFMEALSVIKKNRSQVEDVFYRELDSRFTSFGSSNVFTQTKPQTDSSGLSLLSKEDTDIEVAIKNMTSSATSGSAQEFGALRQRLAVLNNGVKIEDDEIPASPSCLANAFHEAVKDLVLEHQTKLIVYMLFDKFVLGKLSPMYIEYNETLLNAGLLPNLKHTVRKNPVNEKQQAAQENNRKNTTAGSTDENNASDTQSLGDELFGNIMNLMARRDNRPVVSNPLPQTEIVTAIDKVQNSAPVAMVSAEQIATIQPGSQEHETIVSTIKDQLRTERENLFVGIDRRRMPVADTQLIDLVGMMFEYMLKDEDLPNVAKAELCRLHTPYLKVAIIDKNVFSDKQHPAHELLNTLANAAARWVFEDDLERGIFPAVRATVDSVINDFRNNIDLFSTLLVSFNNSLSELVDKASAIEERTRQAAEGKEKLGLARTSAAEAIESSVTGHTVPPVIRKLLGDVWLDKLMFIYLREPDGQNSPSWRLATRTIRDIIWSVEPRNTLEEQNELRENLSAIRSRIEQAFVDLEAYGTCDHDAHLHQIAELQEEALHHPIGKQPAPIDNIASDEQDISDAQVATNDNAQANEEENKDDDLPAEVRAAADQLEQIAFGTWFYIHENSSSHPVRVKLSWYSKMTGNYMFVDSMGIRSTVWKHNELAVLLADGRARILKEENAPFMKRALVAIRRILNGD